MACYCPAHAYVPVVGDSVQDVRWRGAIHSSNDSAVDGGQRLQSVVAWRREGEKEEHTYGGGVVPDSNATVGRLWK